MKTKEIKVVDVNRKKRKQLDKETKGVKHAAGLKPYVAPPDDVKKFIETIETERAYVRAQLAKIIDELFIDENIKSVNDGEVGSITAKLEVPLMYIPFFTREQGLDDSIIAEDGSVINSIYNREPFLTHLSTLVSKVAYLIRYLYEVADFNFFPVSLISNPIDRTDVGIQMRRVLLGKDRGHFMTILYNVIVKEQKFDSAFWLAVKRKLADITEKGNSTPSALKEFQTVGIENTINQLSEISDEFSIKDLIPEKYFKVLTTKNETLQIRLETIDTHKTEIARQNNDENGWRPHNFGLSELMDSVIHDNYIDFNQTELDKMCSDSDVFMGKKTFLSGRLSQNFSGFETEPIMILNAAKDMDFDSKLHKFLSGDDKTERGNTYVTSIVDRPTTTADFKKLKASLEKVALISDEQGDSLWGQYNDWISKAYDEWQNTYPTKGQTNKFSKMQVGSMDTALTMYKAIEFIMKECKIRESGLESTSINFVVWFIEQLKTNMSNFVKRVEESENSWNGRFGKIIKFYVNNHIKYITAQSGKSQSESSLKKDKLRNLRLKAKEIALSHTFNMYDRNTKGWFVTYIDLDKGTGLNLCHYLSAKKAGGYTSSNTDMGPARDNIEIVKEQAIPNGYFSSTGKYITDFKKDFPTPPSDMKGMEAWLNTQKFAQLFD